MGKESRWHLERSSSYAKKLFLLSLGLLQWRNSQSCWVPSKIGSWHLMFQPCACWAEELTCHSGALIRTKRSMVRSPWRACHESLDFGGPCKMKIFLFQRFLRARDSQAQKKTVEQCTWKKRVGRWRESPTLQLSHLEMRTPFMRLVVTPAVVTRKSLKSTCIYPTCIEMRSCD